VMPRRITPYFPSDFTMMARLSSWFASAVQLREMLISTVDRRAELPGLAPKICVPQHILCIVRRWAFAVLRRARSASGIEGNLLLSLQFLVPPAQLRMSARADVR
jgi:hypothetical protein